MTPTSKIIFSYPDAQLPDVDHFEVWEVDSTWTSTVGANPVASTTVVPTDASPLVVNFGTYGTHHVKIVAINKTPTGLQGVPAFLAVDVLLPNVQSLKVVTG